MRSRTHAPREAPAWIAVLALLGLSAPATARAEAGEAHAVRVEGQLVTIDRGRLDGLAVGDRMAVVFLEPSGLGEPEPTLERQHGYVGEIRAVTGHRARIRFGMNERVREGSLLETTDADVTGSILAPADSDAKNELSVGLRLGFVTSGVGGGALVSARYDRRLGARAFVRARLDPTGAIGFRRPDPDGPGPEERPPGSFAATFGGVVMVGADLGLVAIGAGLGATLTTRIDEIHEDCPTCDATTIHHGFRLGPTFATMARIGSRDGLHLDVDTAFTALLARIETSRFAARLVVPCTSSMAIVLSGASGFGVVGTRTIDAGVRLLLRGDGNRGSTLLLPSIGYLAVSERATLRSHEDDQPRPRDPLLIRGLALGLAIERRF